MTVEVKDKFTVKVKRTDHPNAGKYPGRQSQEFGAAFSSFLCTLSPAEAAACFRDELVYEEELSAQFFDSVLVGDIVGLGLPNGLEGKTAAYKFEILSIDPEADTMHARNVTWEDAKRHPEYKGEEVDLTFENFSCALGAGFGEILMRDGKPFGIPEEYEVTVNVMGEADPNVASVSGSAAPVTAASGSSEPPAVDPLGPNGAISQNALKALNDAEKYIMEQAAERALAEAEEENGNNSQP